MRRFLPLFLLLAPAIARADYERPEPGEVAARTSPSDGNWQEAHAIVDAPAEAVRRWMTEFEFWPHRFRDVKATRVITRTGDHAKVWVNSQIMRELTLDVTVAPEGVLYTTNEGNVHASGKILITPRADGRTDVVMASTANLSGFLGTIVPKGMVRSHEREKLVSDLSDLHRLARGHQNALARRPPPARRASTP